MRDFRDAKLMAKVLKQAFADRNTNLSHSEALEIVAAQFGYDQWKYPVGQDRCSGQAGAKAGRPYRIQPPIPIFRIFDVAKAMEFYCDF